jgi:hypothetical protein
VTGVDPTHQLAALIRVQIASLRRRQEAKTGLPARTATLASTPAGTPDLAVAVAQRIRSINTNDPQRERKAFRMFLETVLLSELGQQLVGDPAFALMVDHVQSQMESDPDLARASLEAARLLLKSVEASS